MEKLAFWVVVEATKSAQQDLQELLVQKQLAAQRERQRSQMLARVRERLGRSKARQPATSSPISRKPKPRPQPALNYTRNLRLPYRRLPQTRYTMKDIEAASPDALAAIEDKLNSVGDDAQLANVDLQDVLQKQQQTIQTLANISKALDDTARSVVRNMRG